MTGIWISGCISGFALGILTVVVAWLIAEWGT